MDLETVQLDFETFTNAMNGCQRLMIPGKIKNQTLRVLLFKLSGRSNGVNYSIKTVLLLESSNKIFKLASTET
jgi:hypothetical protein